MKRKVYAVFFILFLLVALFSGYKYFSAEIDYHRATDYYESLSDSWIMPNPRVSVPDQPGDEPAAVPTVFEQDLPNTPAETPQSAISGQTSQAGSDGTPLPAFSEYDFAAGQTEKPDDIPDESSSPLSSVESLQDSLSPDPERPVTETVPPHTNLRPSSVTESEEPSPEYPYTTYEQAPISVDFDGLRSVNPEIIGWIYCEDTPINYPVLQGNDNEKYLKYTPDGKRSKNGSIFVDCACLSNFSSDNTIVYGHNRKDAMFSSLYQYSEQDYYESHPVIWLLTPEANYRIDLFAGMVVDVRSWVYSINLYSDQTWTSFVDSCVQSSDFISAVQPPLHARLITLSTCNQSFLDARYVLVGMLVQSVK
ncbi:MAG: sortase [Clostridia bacterium]|nr:sortase [Clostridia bacterium]